MSVENGIVSFDDLFSKDFCDKWIDYFDKQEELGNALKRTESEKCSRLQKDDTVIFLNPFPDKESERLFGEFEHIFWNKAYSQLVDIYPILDYHAEHCLESVKLQKTRPYQGYHIWHSERQKKELMNRLFAFTLYLNDVDEGGETEFLYQKHREKPKRGRISFFPADYTHVHRGNPPLSNTKYIMTGWGIFV